MTLAPLLSAAPAIQFHAFAAMTAFGLGLVQLAAPKGTLPHRTIGGACRNVEASLLCRKHRSTEYPGTQCHDGDERDMSTSYDTLPARSAR